MIMQKNMRKCRMSPFFIFKALRAIGTVPVAFRYVIARAKLAAIFLLILAVPVFAANLLTNPGYETGDITGWSDYAEDAHVATDTIVHSGSWAGAITDSVGTSCYGFQICPATPTVLYDFSDWVYLSSGTSAQIRVDWYPSADGSGSAISNVSSTTVIADQWVNLSLTGMTAPASAGSCKAKMLLNHVAGAGFLLYYDDAVFEEQGGGDSNSPCAVSNLTAIAGSDDGEVNLMWTAPGSDGTSGDMPAGSSLIIYAATYTLTDTAALSALSQSPYTKYKIEKSTAYTTEWTEHSYTMTGLYPGTTYYFAVTLTDDASNTSVWNYSGAVNTKSTASACDILPAIVGALTASPNDEQITLDWNEPSAYFDVDYYKVEVSSFGTYPDGDFSSVMYSSNVPAGYDTYLSTSLTNHNTYYYRITTYDWGVDTPNGLYSVALSSSYAYANAFPYTTPPAPPGSWAGTGQSSTTIKWYWANVDAETGYRIKCSTNTSTILKELAADVLEWSETNLTINTSYYRVIASSNSAGESALSSAATSWTLANPPGISTFDGVFQSSVTLTWLKNSNPDHTYYGLSWSTNSNFSVPVATPVVFASGLTANTTAVTGLTASTTYYFHVWAYNGDEAVTDFNTAVSTKTEDSIAAGAGSVVINEVAWMGTVASANDEWIELYNTTGGNIDLTGWYIMDDDTTRYDLGSSISANSYYLIEDIEAATDVASDIVIGIGLVNGPPGDSLKLYDDTDALIDSVDCSAVAWFAGSNTVPQKTMERIDPTASGNNAANWANNDTVTKNGLDSGAVAINGTPKAQNSIYSASDTTDPGQVTDLAAAPGTSNGEIYLTWTAPGDDGTSNNLSGGHYLIAMATYSVAAYMENVTSWWQLTPNIIIRSTGATAAVSNPETATITGLTAGDTYYFSIEVYDSSGNDSIYGAKSTSSVTQAHAYAATTVPAPPAGTEIVINEVAPNGTVDFANNDWVELYVSGAGDYSGYLLYERNTLVKTFPASFNLSAGDYVIAHEEAGTDEDNGTGDTNANGYWDIYGAGDFTATDNVISIRDSGDVWIDAMGFSNRDGDATATFVSPYNNMKTEAMWGDGPATFTDGVNDAAVQDALADWSSGAVDRSVGRNPSGTDTNALADWVFMTSPNPGAKNFDSVAPGAVTNLSALTGVGNGEVNLTWTAPGSDGYSENNTDGYYEVRFETFSVTSSTAVWWNNNPANIIIFTSALNLGQTENETIASLTAGTTYYFAVKAYDSSGNESTIDSNSIPPATQAYARAFSAPSDTVPPGPISNLTALTGRTSGTVNLMWTAVGDDGEAVGGAANGYLVKYSQNQITSANFDLADTYTQDWMPLLPGETEGLTGNRVVSGLEPGKTYYFAIKAKDNGIPGDPIWGDWPESQYADDSNRAATNAHSFLRIANTGFELEPELVGWSSNSTSVNRSDSYRKFGTYSCKFNDPPSVYSGRSLTSSRASVTEGSIYTVGAYFYIIQTLGAIADTQILIHVSWWDNTGTFLSSTTSSEITLSAFGEWELQYMDALAPSGASGANFTIQIKEDVNNNNDLYADGVLALIDSIPPVAVSALITMTTATKGEVLLSWVSPGDDGTSGALTGKFRIFYSTSQAQAEQTQAKACGYEDYNIEISTSWLAPGTTVSYGIAGLKPASTYYFCVWACDEVYNWGNVSNIASVYLEDSAPSKPEGLAVELSGDDGGLFISWEANTEPDIAEYRIYRSLTAGFTAGSGNYLRTETHPSTGYENLGLTAGVTYYYRVTAVDSNGNLSAACDEVQCVVTAVGYGESGSINFERFSSCYEEIEDFENATYWSGDITEESSYVKLGDKALKISYSSESSANRIITAKNLSGFVDSDNLCLWVYCEAADELDEVRIILSCDTGFSNTYTYGLFDLSDGWQRVKIDKSSCTSSGTPSWDGVCGLKIEVDGKTGESGYIIVDDLRMVQAENTTGGIWNGTGEWIVAGGTYSLSGLENPSYKGCVSLYQGKKYDDVTIFGKVRIRAGGEAGLVARAKNSSEGYVFSVGETTAKLKLAGGLVLKSETVSVTAGSWYFLKFVVKGTIKEGYISSDGVTYTKIVEENTSVDYSNGAVGIYSGGRADFTGLRVIAVPKNISAVGAYGQVVLNWSISGETGITKYKLYRSTYDGGYAGIGETEDREYQDASLINGVTYYYRICAVDTDGVEGDAAEITGYPHQVSEIETNSIGGIVKKSDGTTLTGIKVKILSGETLVKEDWTDTEGFYEIGGLSSGTYTAEAEWTLNNVISRVGKETWTGRGDINFTLSIDYEVGAIAGLLSLTPDCKILSAGCRKFSEEDGAAFAEVRNAGGEVIVKAAADSAGGFEIPNLLPGTYYVRGYNGKQWSSTAKVELAEGGIANITLTVTSLPLDNVYAYPNPCGDDSINIKFSSVWNSLTKKIRIYTLTGEKVIEAGDGDITGPSAGAYVYTWDLRNSSRRDAANGVYFYTVEVTNTSTGEKKSVNKKFALVR